MSDRVSAPANRLAGLDGAALDAVVIGGGMAGAGVARDLALRGASVALFEKGDFASGTSSKSSKLIHGGLRYLELGDFRLVRESLREKKTLERLVDFDRINDLKTRLSVGAVNVTSGNFAYFDNFEFSKLGKKIGPEHIMASGALPPGCHFDYASIRLPAWLRTTACG